MDLKRSLLAGILLALGTLGPASSGKCVPISACERSAPRAVRGSNRAPHAGPGGAAAHGLDCTNDYDRRMSCHFQARNCTEHNVTVRSDQGHGVKHCIAKECEGGQCCCSVLMMLVNMETHTVTVWKGGERMESKVISVTDSRKPNKPIIVSVTELYGNFEIRWKTNMADEESLSSHANVTYRKKGGTENVTETVQTANVNGLCYAQIPGKKLEPSTTYLVSVKSHAPWSHPFSDSSDEKEFTTPKSPDVLVLASILSLSVASVIISIAVYGCYVKFKTKWWDTVAKCPNPKLLTMHPSEHKLLRPQSPIISSICVQPFLSDDSKLWSKVFLSGSSEQSSGISDGSSCLSYAKTESVDVIAGVQDALCKALPSISPIAPVTAHPQKELSRGSALVCAPYNHFGVRADDISSGLSCFDNKTYSFIIPSCPQEITAGSSEGQVEMFCDAAYQPSEGDTVMSSYQQAPTCPFVDLPTLVSPLMPTDMSYQQCNPDSGRVSYAGDSSLSPDTAEPSDPVLRVEVGSQSCDAVGGAAALNGKTGDGAVCGENAWHGRVPAGSRSFPPVDNDYQPFQNPEASLNHLSTNAGSSAAPGSVTSVPGRDSELPSPLLPLICGDQGVPAMADSGYQSV